MFKNHLNPPPLEICSELLLFQFLYIISCLGVIFHFFHFSESARKNSLNVMVNILGNSKIFIKFLPKIPKIMWLIFGGHTVIRQCSLKENIMYKQHTTDNEKPYKVFCILYLRLFLRCSHQIRLRILPSLSCCWSQNILGRSFLLTEVAIVVSITHSFIFMPWFLSGFLDIFRLTLAFCL